MNKFSIFMKSGGGDSVRIVDKYFKKLTSIFDEISMNDYSQETEHFHIELRVDGDYFSFEDTEGCNNLRFFRKKHLIANSISFGKDVYLNENKLNSFIKENILIAFTQIVKRLEKDKIDINGKKLLEDLNEKINDL